MRSWIGLSLLAVLLLLGIGSTYIMEKLHQPEAQILEQAARAALAGDEEQATALFRQAEERWQCHRKVTAALTDHNPMDAIDEHFAEAGVLAAAQQWEELAACCRQLAVSIRSVCEDQSLTWWNLL